MTESAKTASPRLHVEIKNQSFPVIFSYRELLKQNKKEQQRAIAFPPTNNADDQYFQNLLARAAQYDTNEGDDVEDNDSEDENAGADKAKRGVHEDYDYDDPFIDDSEMLVDEPTQAIPLPEYDGFFVYHGPLDGNDLPEAKKQAKANKQFGASSSSSISSKDVVVPSTTLGDSSKEKSVPSPSKERKTLSTINDIDMKKTVQSTTTTPPSTTGTATPSSSATSTPKKWTGAPAEAKPKPNTTTSVELYDLSPEINRLMEQLKELSKKESFAHKAKFPPALRPLTLDIGRIMFREDHNLDNNVVNHLMKILPYNRFTLNKFLTTKAGPDRIKELKEQNQKLMVELKTMVDSQFPEQEQQYNDKLAAARAAANPQTLSQEAQDNSHAVVGSEEDVMAQKKYRFNDDGRRLLHKILNNDLASNQLSNDIFRFQGKESEIISENKARKQIYLELLKCFPKGWMTTIEMSRQNSQYKAKIDKQNNRPSHGTSTIKRPLPVKEQKQNTVDNSNPDIIPQKRERELDHNTPNISSSVKRQMIVFDSPPHSDTTSLSPIHQHTTNNDHSATTTTTSSSPWDRPESMMIKSLISDNK
ncbi:hypothetical protein BDC45DRAFT_513968 [Circinella umbellata]|nr:hypothetical protein BDC45DRAFT_513968 [Circinella umbellata]